MEQLNTSSAEREVEEELFIEGIGDEDENTAWFALLQLKGKTVQFKLDTAWFRSHAPLFPTTHLRPFGVMSRRLHPKFCMDLQTTVRCYGAVCGQNHTQSLEPIFVMRGLNSNLLGLPAIRALQLVARTDAISQYEEQIHQKYPHLFIGLETLGPEYTIKLKANAKPNALSTPRSVPQPLKDKVKKELDRMEIMGAISRVDDHSDWCVGMHSCGVLKGI